MRRLTALAVGNNAREVAATKLLQCRPHAVAARRHWPSKSFTRTSTVGTAGMRDLPYVEKRLLAHQLAELLVPIVARVKRCMVLPDEATHIP